ncbi:MAG: hypothetical protein ABR860_05830 [Terracidiphilus sp.]|jgi:hypothetical protein
MRSLLARLYDANRRFWKWCRSFAKTGWELQDYPVSIKRQSLGTALPPRFTQHQYWARVLGWHIDAGGASKAEALSALGEQFAKRKSDWLNKGRPLPRPGVDVPIEFASQKRVNAHIELAQDFIHRVLGLPSAWISDESSLWDFHFEETNDSLLARIKEVYGVDVSDIESAKLCEIFDRIAQGAAK